MLEDFPLRLPLLSILLAMLALGGCAANSTAVNEEEEQTAVEISVDPWEPLNRRIFRFNRAVDRATLRPVATAYEKVIPSFMRQGVRNFMANLRGPRNIINNFLQGKGSQGFSETGRLIVNSTIGVLGLVDVASGLGLENHREDFGQTLAVWGVGDGPYVMVPFAGPQTLRDVFAFPVDVLTDPVWYLYLFWLPKFLDSNFGVQLAGLAAPLVTIYLVADVGSVGGGWLSSSLIGRGWSVNRARKTAMLAAAVVIVPTAFAPAAPSMWIAVGLVSVAAAAHQWWSANLFTLVSDLFPRKAVASVVGIGGFCGSFAGVLFQRATGMVLDATGSNYAIPFAYCGMAYLLAIAAIHVLVPRMTPVLEGTTGREGS